MHATVVCFLLVILTVPFPAGGQDILDIGVFADGGTTSTLDVVPGGSNERFDVVAFGLDEALAPGQGIYYVFFGITWPAHLENLVSTTSAYGVRSPGRIDFGFFNRIPSPEPVQVLLTGWISGRNEIPHDTPFCIEGSLTHGFTRPAVRLIPAPRDLELYPAQNGQGRYPDGCLILNPTMEGPVTSPESSWGAVKALY